MKKQLFLILPMAFAIYSSGQQTITETPDIICSAESFGVKSSACPALTLNLLL